MALATGAALVLGAVVAVVGIVAGGWFGSTQLDITAAQNSIQKVLSDPANGFGTAVTDVKCNRGQNPAVTKGGTFTCTATIDGTQREVQATFTDDNGNYDISAPR
ncbi:hypothetical protein B1R94_27670 [Mycolicibacterium litorale]|nr:hypothetical protein B1R94_27670 [Mycolicibacterium litorale]